MHKSFIFLGTENCIERGGTESTEQGVKGWPAGFKKESVDM